MIQIRKNIPGKEAARRQTAKKRACFSLPDRKIVA
jgi:hypothetical protein